MKKIIFLLSIILTNCLFSQNKIEQIDSNIYIVTDNKEILVKEGGEFIFLSKKSDSIHNEEVKYHGEVLLVKDSLIIIDCYYYTEKIYDSVIINKSTTILNNGNNLLTLNSNNFDGFYYSSKWRIKTNEFSKSLFFGSLFVGLVIAPIISFEYFKINNNTSGFNRKLYTNTLTISFISLSVSVPIYYISKPKYFKLH
jgi:hypothetical protein